MVNLRIYLTPCGAPRRWVLVSLILLSIKVSSLLISTAPSGRVSEHSANFFLYFYENNTYSSQPYQIYQHYLIRKKRTVSYRNEKSREYQQEKQETKKIRTNIWQKVRLFSTKITIFNKKHDFYVKNIKKLGKLGNVRIIQKRENKVKNTKITHFFEW